jgi:transposase InsO family protein
VLRQPIESAQFTAWTFTDRAKKSGLLPSMGSVGDCYDTQKMMAPVALRFAV